jgi:hypothetical protein
MAIAVEVDMVEGGSQTEDVRSIFLPYAKERKTAVIEFARY